MKKFSLTFKQTCQATFNVEANDADEAKQLFADKMRNDDYFCDEVYEYLENGVIDEELTTEEIADDSILDLTYDEMKEEN